MSLSGNGEDSVYSPKQKRTIDQIADVYDSAVYDIYFSRYKRAANSQTYKQGSQQHRERRLSAINTQ